MIYFPFCIKLNIPEYLINRIAAFLRKRKFYFKIYLPTNTIKQITDLANRS